MSRKLPLTVTMTARNAASLLPLLLGSVADLASQIVVVVNDCADETVAVARSLGAEVHERPFENLRDQKGKALRLAAQPWTLHLDADEALSPEARAELVAFFDAGTPADGAWFPRRLRFLGRWMRHGDVYPDRVLRLFRTGKGREAGAPEHDRFEVAGTTVRFRGDILHHSNDSMERQVAKINFFTAAFVERERARGKRFRAAEAVFRSLWRFFRGYVLRRGFLDGFPGFHLAYFAAFTTYLRYARLYEAELRDKE